MGMRMPVFDIKVRAQKSNAFSRISQNEMAKEFYGLGFFNPQFADQALSCMEMMDFEGKDAVMQRIAQNGTLYDQLQQMQAQMVQMQAVMQAAGMIPPMGGADTAGVATPEATGGADDPMSRAVAGSASVQPDTARARAMGQ